MSWKSILYFSGSTSVYSKAVRRISLPLNDVQRIHSKMDIENYYSDDTSNYSYSDSYELYNYYYSMRQNMSYMEVPLIRQPVHMIIIFSIAYGLVFIFAVVGNFLVIAVIFKTPAMRNVTNYFILNLAFADILVAVFVLPITVLANIFSGE